MVWEEIRLVLKVPGEELDQISNRTDNLFVLYGSQKTDRWRHIT